MKYTVNYSNAVIVLPKDIILDKLPDAGLDELRFLIGFMADESVRLDYEANADELSAQLKMERKSLDSALAYWRGAGVISETAGEQKKSTARKVHRHASTPIYSGEELGRIIDENGLCAVVDECQRLTGKIFNQTEVNRIAALNSYLGLDAEFILLMFSYCTEHGKQNLKFIEKFAYDLYDRGVDTFDKLEEYIKKEEEKTSLTFKLRRMFGWGERELTPAEKKHIGQWIDEFGYGEEIIAEAYNITVEKTGKLSLPYLTKILSNWYGKGLKSIDDVHTAANQYAKDKTEQQSVAKDSFDIDEFFELSLKRSREKMKKD